MLSLSKARVSAPQGVLVENDSSLLDFNATWIPGLVS